jgi:hypothetical protein
MSCSVATDGARNDEVIRGGTLEDRSRDEPDQRTWHVLTMRPGIDPLESLRVAVTDAAELLGVPPNIRAMLRSQIDATAPKEWVYALQCNLPVRTTETILIIDQFEELLTQTDESKRSSFIDWIINVTSEASPISVRVVCTLRSDYFNLCSRYDKLWRYLHRERVTALRLRL